jgi:hypothetical protein
MSISKMYSKRVSYKLAIDALAEEFLRASKEEELPWQLTLYSMAHTLAVTMGLVTALVCEDMTKKVIELQIANKAA